MVALADARTGSDCLAPNNKSDALDGEKHSALTPFAMGQVLRQVNCGGLGMAP